MFRLDQEKENCSFYFWITLTYADEFLPRIKNYLPPPHEDPNETCFSKTHCREFFERLRKRYARKNGSKFKHFLVCEYGPNETHRPHYHLLLMVYNDFDLSKNFKLRKEMRDFIIHDAWSYGNVKEKPFHGGVLSYLTKYCCKPDLINLKRTMKPFTLISPGIGECLLDKITEKHKQQMIDKLDFTYRYGRSKIQLPRYYVDKILPHSLQDLRNAIPSDPLDPANWKEYDRIKDIRSRLADRQSALAKKEAITHFDEDYEVMNNRRNYEFTKFVERAKRRKNF